MQPKELNNEIEKRIEAMHLFVKQGKYLDLPTAVNEMLKSICIKNNIPVHGVENSKFNELPNWVKTIKEKSFERYFAEEIVNTTDSLKYQLHGAPKKTVAVSEIFDVDDYRVKITVARKPIRPRKDL